MTTAIVAIHNGKPVTNSRDVAALFGKRHDNVLRAMAAMECSREFYALNFEAVEYRDAKGEVRRAMNMTKDGFVFLVMGFTGTDAARFKEAYIQRFNEMEEALRPAVIGAKVGAYRVAEYYHGEWPLRVLWTDTGPLFITVDTVRMIFPRSRSRRSGHAAWTKGLPSGCRVLLTKRDAPDLFSSAPNPD
ncbi:Phage Rha protein [Devosia sp. DBB001]|nr:Phage Rha protein [Devosia sp. DBB001]